MQKQITIPTVLEGLITDERVKMAGGQYYAGTMIFSILPGARKFDPDCREYKIICAEIADNTVTEMPVVANDRLELIDGRKFVEACIAAGRKFKFTIEPGAGQKDLERANSHRKNMAWYDYMNKFVNLFNLGEENYRSYVLYDAVCQNLKPATHNARLLIISADPSRNAQDLTRAFKLGNFRCEAEDLDFCAYVIAGLEIIRASNFKNQTYKTVFIKWVLNVLVNEPILKPREAFIIFCEFMQTKLNRDVYQNMEISTRDFDHIFGSVVTASRLEVRRINRANG